MAIKVQPDALAADPERIARFEREAKVRASLSHHNIAALFGMDEADGRHVLALIDAAQTQSGAPAAPQLQVVLNWSEELKQRVPTR